MMAQRWQYVWQRSCVSSLYTGMKQGHVMSLWLFNVYMARVTRKMKEKVMGAGETLIRDGRE